MGAGTVVLRRVPSSPDRIASDCFCADCLDAKFCACSGSVVSLFHPCFRTLTLGFGMLSCPNRARALTVCSKNVSDRLMKLASLSCCPDTDVFFTRSLPARSTKLSLATVVFSLESPTPLDSR